MSNFITNKNLQTFFIKFLEPKFDRLICATKLNEKNKQRVRVDKEQEVLLFEAISFCENLICLSEVYFQYTQMFLVKPITFLEHLKQVNIEFADWKIYKGEHEERADDDDLVVSWTDRSNIHRMMINSIFYDRYVITSSQEEKQRIIFIVGMCILRELANLALQWTDAKGL